MTYAKLQRVASDALVVLVSKRKADDSVLISDYLLSKASHLGNNEELQNGDTLIFVSDESFIKLSDGTLSETELFIAVCDKRKKELELINAGVIISESVDEEF